MINTITMMNLKHRDLPKVIQLVKVREDANPGQLTPNHCAHRGSHVCMCHTHSKCTRVGSDVGSRLNSLGICPI